MCASGDVAKHADARCGSVGRYTGAALVSADTRLAILYDARDACASGSDREVGGALRAKVGGGAGKAAGDVALDTSGIGGVEDVSVLALGALHGGA